MRRLAPYHWALWVGFALRAAGSFWDSRWHSAHGRFDGPANILQAHWLMLLGVLVLAVVPFLALRHLSDMLSSRLLILGFGVAMVFGLAQLVGMVWDTGLHMGLWDINEALGHQLASLGWIGASLGLAGIASAYMLIGNGTSQSGATKP